MWRVTVSDGTERRTLCVARGQAARLGSAPDNELTAPFVGVSRRHARLEGTADGVLLLDLDSKNGLVWQGRRHDSLLVPPGRRVLVGRAYLEVESVSSADLVVALELDRTPTPPPHLDNPPTQETRALRDLENGSPAPALRLVRRLSRSDPAATDPAALLDEARPLLGALWLAILELDDETGELSVAGWSGAAVGAATLEPLEATLAAERRGRGDVTRIELRGVHVLGASPDGDRWLAGAFEAARRPQVWVEELLSFLAEHLLASLPGAAGAAEGEPGNGEPGARAPRGGDDPLDYPPGMVVGPAPAMADLLRQLRATVRSDLPVLISGETGVGKELVARLVHRSSPKAEGPFVAINCAAIPGELLEAELFGVAARVATGVDPRPGLFVTADGGTLFLDEVGDMPHRLQAKLLRVLQEREVWPVGRSRPQPVDVRVLAATNRDLATEVADGRFRLDLFYRLGGLHFEVPPLRRRRDDLPALIHQLASRAAAKYDKRIAGVTRPALALLMEHPWPGNVRELEHELERAVLLCPHGGALEPVHFPDLGRRAPAPPGGGPEDGGGGRSSDEAAPEGATGGGPHSGTEPVAIPTGPAPGGAEAGAGDGSESFRPLQERLDAVEAAAIREALAAAGGVKAQAARLLGVTRNGLALKMKRLGLDADGETGTGQGGAGTGSTSG